MSRRAPSYRPARAVLALAVGATSVVGLAQASAAPPAIVVTGVSPAIVEADVSDAFGVTLSGKGFGRDTVVTLTGCTEAPVVVPPSTVTATKLVVRPPKCAAGPVDVVVTKGAGTSPPTSTLKGGLTFLTTPAIAAPTAPATAVTPATGSWAGGSAASVELEETVPRKAAVQVLVTSGGSTRRVPAKADAANAKRVTFKVPAGQPGAKADVAVSVAGIESKALEGQFTYVSTLRTSPAVWVKGAPAPAVKVAGAGFTKEATVKVCGVLVPASGVVVTSSKSLVVAPPAWDGLPGEVSPEEGGVCTVQVTVGDVVSAITAGSTFTYATH